MATAPSAAASSISVRVPRNAPSTEFRKLYELGIAGKYDVSKEMVKNIINNEYKELDVAKMKREDRFAIYVRFRSLFREYRPLKKKCVKECSIQELRQYFYLKLKDLIRKIQINQNMSPITIDGEIFLKAIKNPESLDLAQILSQCTFKWENQEWTAKTFHGALITDPDKILLFLYQIFYKTSYLEAQIRNEVIKFNNIKHNGAVRIPDINSLGRSCVLLYPDFGFDVDLPLFKGSVQYDMSRIKTIIPHSNKINKNLNEPFNIQEIVKIVDNKPEKVQATQAIIEKYFSMIVASAIHTEYPQLKLLTLFVNFLTQFFLNKKHTFFVGKRYGVKTQSFSYHKKITNAQSENDIFVQETLTPKTLFQIDEFQYDPKIINSTFESLFSKAGTPLKSTIFNVLNESVTIKCYLCNEFRVPALKIQSILELQTILFNHFKMHYESSLVTWKCSECSAIMFDANYSEHGCKADYIMQLNPVNCYNNTAPAVNTVASIDVS